MSSSQEPNNTAVEDRRCNSKRPKNCDPDEYENKNKVGKLDILKHNVKTPAALIISNDYKGVKGVQERKGAQKDVDRVIKLLKDDLKVNEPQQALNLTTENLKIELEKFAKSEAAKKADCLLVFVMSHGKNGVVCTMPENKNNTDTIPTIRYQEIWGPILDQHTDKPVLFLFQSCQGRTYDEGQKVEVMAEMDGKQADKTWSGTAEVDADPGVGKGTKGSKGVDLPNKSNVLLAFATIPEYYCYRHAEGSFFMRAVCEEMEKRKDADDIIKVLTRVNRCVSKEPISCEFDGNKIKVKQCCSVISFLTQKIVFPRSN